MCSECKVTLLLGSHVGVFVCQFEQESECCRVVDRDFPSCVGAAATPTHLSHLSFVSPNPLVFNLSSFLT